MPRAKLCAECRHPKSHHRTASCRHTWQAMGATFTGNRIITNLCLCGGYRDQSRDRNLMWIGDAASYSAVHTRMGSASAHACVDCGESAEEWAYTGGCPRELICPRRQLRYSPDPERYSPRCKSCHLAQDRVRDEKGRLASKGGDAQ